MNEPLVEQIPGGVRVTVEVETEDEDEPEIPPAPDVVGSVLGTAATVAGKIIGTAWDALRPEASTEPDLE